MGIPAIRDQDKNVLALSSFGAEMGAEFEKNSYCFRPGRRPYDAVEAIHPSINKVLKMFQTEILENVLTRLTMMLFWIN